MNNITLITFADTSTVAFATDGSSITTSVAGVSTVYTKTAPIVSPTDTEVDVLMSDGTTKKFIPA